LALNGEATNDVDLILWNPEKKEKKRVLISGRPLVERQCGCGSNNHQRHQSLQKLEEELKETESKYRQLIGFKVKMKNKRSSYKYG
jgi:hypothetical protein